MNEPVTELSREELLARYASQPTVAAERAKRRSPFKFLDSYDLDDADIFFGRDFEIEELLRNFHSYPHLLIYGESGAGKSSLVQCGLRSRIPEADALFVPLRVHTAGLPTVGLQVCTHAFHALDEFIDVPADAGLVETLRAVREAASRPLVLFFDQFEELFIFHDAETRRRFAEELAAIAKAKLNVKVVIGVRQDYLAQLSELEDTVEGLFDNRFWLRRMSRENAAQAVVQACGSCDVKIDGELADSILQRLDPSGRGVELPYLQVVMDRLYRQAVDANPAEPVISATDVTKLGDIANILGSFLVEEVAKLPSPDSGRQILKAFVTREGTRRTLNRESLALESAGFGKAIAADVLEAHLNQLASVRILREIADSGTYELRHDALAATISGWISEVEKELIEVRDNLANRFKEYEARGGPAAALLDQSFMDYLDVYRKRLGPLLSDPQSRYLQASEQRLRRLKRIRQTVTAGGVAAALFAVVAVGAYLQHQDKRAAEQREKHAKTQLIFAKKAVNKMLSEVGSDTLKDVPQMERVRAVLLDDALELFKEISANDATGRFELAMANYQAAEIHRILGEGDHATMAEAAYREAIRELETLCSEFPENRSYRQQLGLSHMWLGELFRVTDKDKRADEATEHYNKAIEIQSELVARADENLSLYQTDLARSHMNRGISRKNSALRKKKGQDIEGSQQDFADAEHDYDEARNLLTAALQGELSDAQDEECHVLLSKTHLNRGLLLKSQLEMKNLDRDLLSDAKRRYVAALDELNQVIATRRKRGLPERLEYNLDIAKYHNNISTLLFQFDPSAEAKEEAALHNAMSIELGKSLNVGTLEARRELARFYGVNAQSLKDGGQRDGAISQWRNAVDVMKTILQQNPADEDAQAAMDKYEKLIEETRAAEQKG